MPRAISFTAFTLLFTLTVAGCGKKDVESDSPSSGGGGSGGDSRPIIGPQTEEARKQTVNRLQQIGLAFHNHEAALGATPAGLTNPKGQLGLSWRVAILPYIEEVKLYKQFKLDEPWDSEHNKKLIPKMPKVFEAPSAISSNGKTFYRSFAGPSAFFQTPPANVKGPAHPPWVNLQPGWLARGRSLGQIVDGTSNTLLLAEAAEPIEWTKPEELPFPDQPGQGEKSRSPLPKLGGIFTGGFYGLMADGSVHFFPDTLTPDDLRRLIWVNDGLPHSRAVNDILFPPRKPGSREPDDEGESIPPPSKPGASKK